MADHPDAIFTEEQRRIFVERLMLAKGWAPERPLCWCMRCRKVQLRWADGDISSCPDCGSAQCQRAYDHREPCGPVPPGSG